MADTIKTQTNSRAYEGQCKFCAQDFTKRTIADHLNRCEKRNQMEQKQALKILQSGSNIFLTEPAFRLTRKGQCV